MKAGMADGTAISNLEELFSEDIVHGAFSTGNCGADEPLLHRKVEVEGDVLVGWKFPRMRWVEVRLSLQDYGDNGWMLWLP